MYFFNLGVFSFLLFEKNRFYLILYNKIKHHTNVFGKNVILHLDFSHKRQKRKKLKEPQETLVRTINSAF
jgi:hypothetical protein